MNERLVLKIEADLCLGCGQCLPSCPNGAIAVTSCLAGLVDEALCDGKGHCLGHCSAGAISLEVRPAKPFDPQLAKARGKKRD